MVEAAKIEQGSRRPPQKACREMVEVLLVRGELLPRPRARERGSTPGASMGYSAHIDVEVEIRGGRIVRSTSLGERETSPLFATTRVPWRIVRDQTLNVAWEPGAESTTSAPRHRCPRLAGRFRKAAVAATVG